MSVALRGARSGCSRKRTSLWSTHKGTAAARSSPSTGANSNAGPTGWPMPRQASSVRLHARSARCARSTSDSSAPADVSRRSGRVFVAPHAGPSWSSGRSSSSPGLSRSPPTPPPRTSTRTAQRMGQCSTATRSPRSHSPPATSTRTGVSTASRSSRSRRATRSSSRPGGSRTGRTRSSSASTACSVRTRRYSASSSTRPRRRSTWMVLPWSAAARRCAWRERSSRARPCSPTRKSYPLPATAASS